MTIVIVPAPIRAGRMRSRRRSGPRASPGEKHVRGAERSMCEAHGVMIPQAAEGKIKAVACGRKARGQHRETEEKGQRTEHED